MTEVKIPPKSNRGRKPIYDDEYHRVAAEIMRENYYKRKAKKAAEDLRKK